MGITDRGLLMGGAVLVLALGGCETVADGIADSAVAGLSGAQEVPGPGDLDGRGRAEITIVDATDNVCFDPKVRAIAPATAAHIHRGRMGVAGPPVVPLSPPIDGERDGCVATSGALADEIKANPSDFHVNIHSAEFPNGAVRGQLRRTDSLARSFVREDRRRWRVGDHRIWLQTALKDLRA